MQIIISPAKKMDFSRYPIENKATLPEFVEETNELVVGLRKYNPAQLADLLGINPDLANLNYQRFLDWELPFTKTNSKEAILAYTGEVFRKMDAKSFSKEELDFAQEHLLILSGLFGALRPFDWIQPYRLEMATRLENSKGSNLYAFWGNKITDFVNKRLAETNNPVLVNLASQEYFKSLKIKALKSKIITPVFKEFKNGQYKTIIIFAKQARGMMCNFIIKNKLTKVEDLKHFDRAGYHFDANLSSNDKWVFTR